MKIVGLTGGIGSGKSTVAQMFENLGIPVYYSDDRAKQLMVESRSLREKIVDRFGDRAYDEKGLNTEFLAGVVFHDKASLEALNKMVHPEVEKDFRDWVAGQRAGYVVQENPLLFEKNKQDQYDCVIVVTASTETRINRVISRDGVSRAEVEARIQNQMDQDKKVALATYVIENDEDMESCREAVLAVHHHILSTFP